MYQEIEEARGKANQLSQIVTFKVGNATYGLDIMKVREIILMTEIIKVPEVDGVEGVINLRGNVIPIVDLRKRYKTGDYSYSDDTRIVVLHLSDKSLGLIVDEVEKVLRIQSRDISPPNDFVQGQKKHISGFLKLEDEILLLIDIASLLVDHGNVQTEGIHEGAVVDSHES